MTDAKTDAADPVRLREQIEAKAHALGFAFVGVARAQASARGETLVRWLNEGKHGEMAWMSESVALRLDVRLLLKNARSVIAVADRYHDGSPDRVTAGAARGRIARYARGKDYHDLVRDRLRTLGRFIRALAPGCQTRLTGDMHPLLEREQAARALLGSIGKHTLLIRPSLGSYFVLGEIVTDADIAASDDAPSPQGELDLCGSCTRCIDACPTKAITPYSVDATRCTAYLTIEHRGAIASEFFGHTGDWWFGCDICQEVCPHSHGTRASRRVGTNPLHAPRQDSVDLLDVLGWSDEDRARLVVSSALKRATLAMMKRNALLALSSLARDNAELATTLAARCHAIVASGNEDEIVTDAARCVLALGDASPNMSPNMSPKSRRSRAHEAHE